MPSEAALPPSEDDIREYRRRGWFRAGKLFTDDTLDEAVLNVERHYAGHRDHDVAIKVKEFLNWSPRTGNPLRVNDYIAVQNDSMAALATAPLLGAVAARLTGAESIRVFNTSLIYKPPRVTGDAVQVGWHNDRAYWQMCTSSSMLTAWIALCDVEAVMGPLTVIDESNRWVDGDPRIAQLRRGKSFISSDVAALEEQLRATGNALRKIPFCLRRGEVSFHDNRTFHGSDVNRGSRPRIGLVVHLQDGANRHRRACDENGERYVHSLDAMVRRDASGNPDYADPTFCPVIWSAHGGGR